MVPNIFQKSKIYKHLFGVCFTIFNLDCTAIYFYQIIIYTAQVKSKKEQKVMDKYLCKVCGYIYDPEENNNIPFSDLPADWLCPLCNAPKEEFTQVL